jgi:hypothetical protein
MPTIQILVRVTETISTELPGPIAQGKQFIFSDNLVLERYDDSTPGSGLPDDINERRAGTRISDHRPSRCGGRSFSLSRRTAGWSNEATYMFNTLDDTPLQKGQITAQGQFVLDQGGNRLEEPSRFSITGGTGPYNSAHGKITEGFRRTPTEDDRLLDIEL